MKKSMRKSVAANARCESRLMVETNKPAAREKNSAFSNASEVFQNSAPVTPPINKVRATIGKKASSGKKPRKDVASSLPATTS